MQCNSTAIEPLRLVPLETTLISQRQRPNRALSGCRGGLSKLPDENVIDDEIVALSLKIHPSAYICTET
jgi:hypothetical protein